MTVSIIVPTISSDDYHSPLRLQWEQNAKPLQHLFRVINSMLSLELADVISNTVYDESSTITTVSEGNAVSHTSLPSSHPNFNRRKRSPNAVDNGDDENDENKGKRVKHDSGMELSSVRRKFACPYYKKNPQKFTEWRACAGPGWESIHRVKEHLYRRHPLPIQCPRCGIAFEDENQLRAHIVDIQPCQIQPFEAVEGISKDQEKKLRSRRRTNQSEEDKWRDVYRTLFPHVDNDSIPSPYYDTPAVSKSQNLEEFEAYLNAELPRQIHRDIESSLRSVFAAPENAFTPRETVLGARENSLPFLSSIQDIVRNSLANVFQYFRAGSSPEDTLQHTSPEDHTPYAHENVQITTHDFCNTPQTLTENTPLQSNSVVDGPNSPEVSSCLTTSTTDYEGILQSPGPPVEILEFRGGLSFTSDGHQEGMHPVGHANVRSFEAPW